LQLAKTLKAMLSTSNSIIKYNKVALEVYIKSVNIVLAIKLLISLTCNLLAIFKAKYSKSILPFKISFIIIVYIILLISNKDTNITQKVYISSK
jgi:hypothetical protein